MRGLLCFFVCLLVACSGLLAVPVTGTLTDSHAKPVAGARVISVLYGAEGQPCAPKTEASVITDAEGNYSLDELSTLTENQYRVIAAYLPGKYIGWTMQSTHTAEMERFFGKPRPLTVAPTVMKKGIVVDRAGRPVAGVSVKYVGLNTRQGYPMFLPGNILQMFDIPTNLTSGKDGTYTIMDAAADADVVVTPRKKGFAALNSRVDPGNLRIVIVPAGRIEGQVRDIEGKPLKGVDVAPFQGGNSRDVATSDSRGRFVIADLSPGTWSVSANMPGRAFPLVDNVKVKAGETTRVSPIVAMRTSGVSGKVVYAETGKPVQGVSVSVMPLASHGWTGSMESTTNATGAFKSIAPSGKCFLILGGLPTGYLADQTSRAYTVPKAGLSGLTVKLTKAEVGRGRVVDEKGQPVAGAEISFYGQSSRTGDDGAFSLTLPRRNADDGFSPFGGNTVTLEVRQEARKLGAIDMASRSDLLKDKVTVTVGPVLTVKVHVTLPSGKPAVGAKMSTVTNVGNEGTSSRSSGPSEIRADVNGNASVGDLLPGAGYDIVASFPGYFDAGGRPRITPDSAAPSTITIKLQSATRVQTGRVIDEKARPVAGAEITAEGQGMEPISSAKTDAKGHFLIRGLPDGRVSLSVNKGNRFGYMAVSKSSGAIVIQIAPQGPDHWGSD